MDPELDRLVRGRVATAMVENAAFTKLLLYKTAENGTRGYERFLYPQSVADRIYQFMPERFWYVTIKNDAQTRHHPTLCVWVDKHNLVFGEGVEPVPVAEGVKMVVRYLKLMLGA